MAVFRVAAQPSPGSAFARSAAKWHVKGSVADCHPVMD